MAFSPRAWILAARPKTLPAAVAPVAAGTLLGGKIAGEFHLHLAWWALASCMSLQIATNFFNDLIDHKKGADTDKRLGPARMTASGALSPRKILWAAFFMLLLAAGCALPLWQARGWPIVALGIPSLYLCYGYTGGPLPLAYRGLGELFVLIFFGWVAVIGSCFLQTGGFELEAVLLGTQIGLLSTALIAINNLRDHEEDAQSGKRTLAVRMGERWAKVEIGFCLLAPVAIGLFWEPFHRPAVAWWPFLTWPLAWGLALGIRRAPPSPLYNRFLALSALHLVLVTVAIGTALLLR